MVLIYFYMWESRGQANCLQRGKVGELCTDQCLLGLMCYKAVVWSFDMFQRNHWEFMHSEAMTIINGVLVLTLRQCAPHLQLVNAPDCSEQLLKGLSYLLLLHAMLTEVAEKTLPSIIDLSIPILKFR